MKCTGCNQPIRPVIASDIDGTLGQYHDHFLRFASKWFGTHFGLGYDGLCELYEWMGVSQQDYRACKLAYRQGGMKRIMPPYPGYDRIIGLREQSELWLTTTRPYLRLDNVDPDTREWCSRNGVAYSGLIYDDDKYKRLAEIVGEDRVVGVLEDLPELYDRAEDLGLNPILILRPHNSHAIRGRQWAGSLYAAAELLANRVERWYKAHGTS